MGAGSAAQLCLVFSQHLTITGQWYFMLRPPGATIKQKYCLKDQFPETISISKLIYLKGREFEPPHVWINRDPVTNAWFYLQINGARSDPVFTAAEAFAGLQRSGLGNFP